jgi:hypothetical protein
MQELETISTITVTEVKNYILENEDFMNFFTAVKTIGQSLNSRGLRFLKSRIIEQAFQYFSKHHESILRVDEWGVDHLLVNLKFPNTDQSVGVEMKFSNELHYAARGRGDKKILVNMSEYKEKKGKSHTISLKLLNSNGENKHTELPPTYSKFVLAVDSYSMFVIATEDLAPYLKINGDGILADKVPANLFTKVIGADHPHLASVDAIEFDIIKELDNVVVNFFNKVQDCNIEKERL